MTVAKEEDTKIKFKRDFEDGELFLQWQNIYESSGYLSRVASHRMKTVLKLIDSYKMGRNGLSLDIGTGSGDMIRELLPRSGMVFGADFSIDMIRGSRTRLRKFENKLRNRLMVADVESLPIGRDTFDLVTCLGVLEYLSTDRVAMAELFRILRPRGYLLLVVGSYHRIGQLMGLLKKKILKRNIKALATDQNRSLKNRIRTVKPVDFRSEAIEAGFEIKKFMCFGGKLFGRYYPIRLYVPGLIYIGDLCLLVLKKPS